MIDISDVYNFHPILSVRDKYILTVGIHAGSHFYRIVSGNHNRMQSICHVDNIASILPGSDKYMLFIFPSPME